MLLQAWKLRIISKEAAEQNQHKKTQNLDTKRPGVEKYPNSNTHPKFGKIPSESFELGFGYYILTYYPTA